MNIIVIVLILFVGLFVVSSMVNVKNNQNQNSVFGNFMGNSCASKDINCTRNCQCPPGKVCCSANGVNQCGQFYVQDTDGSKYCW